MCADPCDRDGALVIDGSAGEGGGQLLRSALALSVCRRQLFRIVDIRGRRPKPGLRPQHLAAVRAAAAISGARVEGAAIDAREIAFVPGPVAGGAYRFAVGTAGSTGLVLQTVLPALVTADRPSELVLEGGTHNPRAPTFEFLARAYLPLIERMGPRVAIGLERAGFEPAGGGRVRVRVEPVARLEPLRLETRGALQALEAEVMVSKLSRHIAEREAAVLAAGLSVPPASARIRVIDDSPGPGNVVSVFAVSENVTEVFTGFGRRGVPAERVAEGVVESVQRYLSADVPVGVHLADQLLLPLALAGGGSFVTCAPSAHTLSNIDVIERFLPVAIRCAPVAGADRWRIEIGGAAS
ncbi:MAG TPA: RNA 3'-terminal phosphate cyclase [Gammaproteobacteria bacterium]